MQEFLSIVEKVTLTSFLIFSLGYALSGKRNFSLIITLVIVFISEAAILFIEPGIWLIKDHSLLRFAWYASFIMTEMFVVFSIVKLHNLYNLAFSFPARHTTYAYLATSAYQLLTYITQETGITSFFLDIHGFVVPSIFVAVNGVLIASIIQEIFGKTAVLPPTTATSKERDIK